MWHFVHWLLKPEAAPNCMTHNPALYWFGYRVNPHTVYLSSCIFFSAMRAWSCCCWASLCFATDFSKFLAPIAWEGRETIAHVFFSWSNRRMWRIQHPWSTQDCNFWQNISIYIELTFIFSVSASFASSSTSSIKPPTIFWNWPISAKNKEK